MGAGGEGVGIESDHVSSVTDAHSKASTEIGSHYGGAGLGLSLSRKILQLYGSVLQVDSTSGSGSTFSFEVTLERAQGGQA